MSTVVTYTTDASGAQDGSDVGGWDAELDGLTLSTAFLPSTIGMLFNIGLSFNSSGVALDPPIVSDAQLRLTTHPSVVVDPGLDTIEVWCVPEAAPAEYGATKLPFARAELKVSGANYVWNGVGTTLTLTIGTHTSAAATATCKDNWQTIRALSIGSHLWSGKIALSLKNLTGGFAFAFNSTESAGQSPELLLTQTPFFAGLIGGPLGKRRFVRDGRFGMPALNTELVRDGYNPSLYVRAFDQDPEDPPTRYRPRKGEGTVDDDIPDL